MWVNIAACGISFYKVNKTAGKFSLIISNKLFFWNTTFKSSSHKLSYLIGEIARWIIEPYNCPVEEVDNRIYLLVGNLL